MTCYIGHGEVRKDVYLYVCVCVCVCVCMVRLAEHPACLHAVHALEVYSSVAVGLVCESTSHLQTNKFDVRRNLMYFGLAIFACCQKHVGSIGQ